MESLTDRVARVNGLTYEAASGAIVGACAGRVPLIRALGVHVEAGVVECFKHLSAKAMARLVLRMLEEQYAEEELAHEQPQQG